GVSHVHSAYKVGGRILRVHIRAIYENTTDFLLVAGIALIRESGEADRVVVVRKITRLCRQNGCYLRSVIWIWFAHQTNPVTLCSVRVIFAAHCKIKVVT